MTKRMGGGAFETMVVILLLVLVAGIYILLNWAISGVNVLATTTWSGDYDSNSSIFMGTIWTWLPIIVFFVLMLYLFVRYQRRSPYE